MDRRPHERQARLVLPLLAAIAACGEQAREQAAPPPNVIVYLVDTLRADHLGCYGYPLPTSPHVDAFAAEGTLFEEALAQSSWTKPSVGSLFTGLLPTHHGAERREHALRAGVPTLAATLREAGYTTCAVVTNPNVLPVFGFDAGFDEFIDVESVKRSARAQRVHEVALEWLDRRPAGPFFLYIHARDPHAPYEPPAPFLERFQPRQLPEPPRERAVAVNVGLYDGEIAYWDEQMGQLFDALRSRELYDSSVIALLSDHGEEFTEHGRWGHGETLFREQLHVPLMMRFPGGQPAQIAQPVRVVDIAPTLYDLLDIAPPEMDGSSFLDALRGTASYAPELYAQLNHDAHLVSSLRRGRYKFIERRARGRQPAERWLFDTVADPRETTDLVDEQADVARQLGEELSRLEASLHHGLYLEICNGLELDDVHRMQGTLTLKGGSFAEIEARDFEPDDVLHVSDDRTVVEFDLHLTNRPNPIGQNPPLLRDVDRIRIVRPTATAEIELDVRLDGQALGARRMALGDEEYQGDYPLRVRANSPLLQPALANHARTNLILVDQAYCRLFAIAETARREIEIEDELEQRLIELGYTGD